MHLASGKARCWTQAAHGQPLVQLPASGHGATGWLRPSGHHLESLASQALALISTFALGIWLFGWKVTQPAPQSRT